MENNNKFIPVKGQFTRCIRRVGDIWLFFWTKDTVYAYDGKSIVLFNRWFDHERSSFTNRWHPFVTYAKRGNGITMPKLIEKAASLDIGMTSTRSLPGEISKILPERYTKW